MLDAYADRWALVTGASSGIGAEFARQLAARGMHLVLVARRQELMKELAAELDTRHGTKCEIVVSDLSDPAASKLIFDDIANRELNIDVLVNNAGFGFVGVVDDVDISRMMQMIQLNISSATDLIYRLLPGMLERKRGAIINVSSLAAFQPVAYMSVYAATKAYMLHLSEALWAEVKERGVTVMALCPGTTETDFFDVAGISGWLKKHRAQTPEQVVKTAMKALDRGKQYVVPGLKNYLISLGVRLARRKMVVLQSMKYFRPTRKTTDDSADPNPKSQPAA